jgi:hypothetical protein
MFSEFPLHPPPENLAAYDVMWKNLVQTDRPRITILRMHIVSYITQATNTWYAYTDIQIKQKIHKI